MDVTKKLELLSALQQEMRVVSEGPERYDPNTGTIYARNGNYTTDDLKEVQTEVQKFQQKCWSSNSTITLNPSYIKSCEIIDAVLSLTMMEMDRKKKDALKAPDRA